MTTEYFDPDGVFPLLWPQLSAHLPLRNLYWKTASRPVRSIASLDVDFVPATKKAASVTSPEQRHNGTSIGSKSAPSPSFDDSTIPRRHQIPGLHATPYLKLYLLRCDDKDLYKSTHRPKLRDWLTSHVHPGAQSNHDAFEWLILHVVLPDTAAAAQPRFSAKKDDAGDLKERSSKWPGKRNRPLLEKLRADFNDGGGKGKAGAAAGGERVAQIRLARDAVPAGLLRATLPEGVTPIKETVQEQQVAWNDLIAKLKALILSSFNTRVAQYEEDVRERELQRSMPGWNFCTFFILKEGLAQAFEAVGLLEDALLGYDELAVGLDSTLSDQLGGTSSSAASPLAMTTESLHQQLTRLLRGDIVELEDNANRAEPVMDSDTTDYRGLIVSNQISVFDFRCYIFLRQMALLLKLARLTPSFKDSKTTLARLSSESIAMKNQDAVPLTELSHRAAQFASLIGRTMRQDLLSRPDDAQQDLETSRQAIDAMALSWTFSFMQQVLDETVTTAIASPASMRDAKAKSEPIRKHSYPKRQSSLSTTKEDLVESSNAYEDDELYLRNLNLKDIESIKNVELANSAASRAELFLRQRRLLEQLGQQRGWRVGSLSNKSKDDAQHTPSQDTFTKLAHVGALWHNQTLQKAMRSLKDFRNLYELLSDHAAWYFAVANRNKFAEQLIVNQALLKFDDGDYAAAATWFNKLASAYGAQDWGGVEMSILSKYAECLKYLNRKDELVRVRLAMLAKSATPTKRAPRMRISEGNKQQNLDLVGASQAGVAVGEAGSQFNQLIIDSRELSYDITAPLANYFKVVDFDKAISLRENMDGFALSIAIQSLLPDRVTLDHVQVQLVPIESAKNQDILLRTGKTVSLQRDIQQITLDSNISTYGLFRISRLVLQAGRILFTQDFGTSKPHNHEHNILRDHRPPKTKPDQLLLIYPRFGSVSATLRESTTVHLNKQRLLDLELQTGDQAIDSALITIKSATAGLRLHTAHASSSDLVLLKNDGQKAGEISLPACATSSSYHISIPYQLDSGAETLSFKLEIAYRTGSGEFTFRSCPAISTITPLDVSVQDAVKQNAIFSKVSIRALPHSPMLILGVDLQNAPGYDVTALLAQIPASLVTEDSPLSVSYRIRNASQETKPDTPQPLVLHVTYQDVVEDFIQDKLTRLTEAVTQSQHKGHGGLLLHSFEEALREHMKHIDSRRVEMTGEIRLPEYHQIYWSKVIHLLQAGEQRALEEWARVWLSEQLAMAICDMQNSSQLGQRTHQLLLNFSLPNINYAFSASLALTSKDSHHTLSLGEPYEAELLMSYTTRWSHKHGYQCSFTYSILATPDTGWLIVGTHTGTITMSEGEEVTHRLALTPLRSGTLMLPSVRISLAESGEGEETVQTDVRSQYQTVVVVEEFQSSTVAVGECDLLSERVEVLEAGVA